MMSRMSWLVIAVSLALIAAVAWVEADVPSIVQSLQMTEPPNMLAVSPSGNQIAIASDVGLRLRYLEADGKMGESHKFVAMTDLNVVGFSPDGNRIICANRYGRMYVIRRDTWASKTLSSTDGNVATGIDVISQRPEAYIQMDNGAVHIVDFEREEHIGSIRSYQPLYYRAHGVIADPAGTRLVRLLEYPPNDNRGSSCKECFALPYTDGLALWRPNARGQIALGVGPTPDCFMTLQNERAALEVWRFSDGLGIKGCLLTEVTDPVAVANSRDGRWIVVPSHDDQKLLVIWGEDLRQLAPPGWSATTVRMSAVKFRFRPTGVCLHPTLPVAYVWSTDDFRMAVVHLAVEGASN